MGAVLKLVPTIADHTAGAAQAQNLISELRKFELKVLDPIPCERCGSRECGREAAWSRYDVLLIAGAPEDQQEQAFEVWVVLDKRCAANAKPALCFVALIPVSDIETDEQGFVVPNHRSARVDDAWDRAKERRL